VSGDGTATRIQAWASTRRLPEAQTARWIALPEADRMALLDAAENLRLRTGQFVTAFEWLDEIAVREGEPIATVLGRREIRRIIDGGGSTPGRARNFVEQLRTIRFPRLKRAMDRLSEEVAELALPHGIRVVLPRNLSSDELRIEIVGRDAAEIARLIDALAKNRDGLKRITAMLGGADEF